MLTTIHVTHEACEKIGGIGAVLEGMITSPVYQAAVRRTLLVGPMLDHFERPGSERLGPEGEVLYSSLDGIDHGNLAGRLKPIEWAFDVAIVYGRRRFVSPGDGRTGEAEVLLLDVHRLSSARLNQFKARLWQHFGLDSRRYEHDWGFEEYVRLAEPAFHAVLALLCRDELPAVLLSHEFMGLPTALKAILDGQRQVRTLFHAHECSTARRLVEERPGHDLGFYPALRAASGTHRYVDELFGDQSASFRHALVSRAHLCDAVVAVGTLVAEELHFLDRRFDHHDIDLVHNGIPAWIVTPDDKAAARRSVVGWLELATGRTIDLLFTHVTRPVVSKGIWRDLAVCDRLESRLAAEGRTATLLVLTSAGGVRRPHDCRRMASEYGWPASHRVGYPDLVGPEVELASMIDAFNREHRAVQALLVNQFGWSGTLIGAPELDAPTPMDMSTLRAATDAEFGLATYEPFGISPLEPLAAGAICLVSSVCGCRWFAEEAAGGDPAPNVLIADYVRWTGSTALDALLSLGRQERDSIESVVAEQLASRLHAALPRSDEDRARLLKRGQELAARMSWDAVLTRHLVPTLERVATAE